MSRHRGSQCRWAGRSSRCGGAAGRGRSGRPGTAPTTPPGPVMSALCSRCGGTPGYRVKLSVQAGQLLAPAELGLARTVAVSQRGHSKEDGADASPVHFSPSLSRAASATPASLWEAASVQVALLVAVQPGSYKVIQSS